MMPPQDRALSPLTGYTRAHWLAFADAQLAAVLPFASSGGARLSLPGRPSWSGPVSDGLEGFARTFLLACFRVAGEGGDDPAGLMSSYGRGLVAGTDPLSAEVWPAIEDRGQPLVEAASIAIGLHLTRPWLWDELSNGDRSRVGRWLSGAAGVETPDNNWVLFRVVVQEFLASVGMPFCDNDIEAGLARIEDWYVGDGWYRDGSGDNFDYYCGWAMHLYPILWARMAQDRLPELAAERLATYRERLRRFLQDYIYFFGADGAPVFQGRSLIYRCAATAPLWLGELLDVSPVSPGAVRRVASGSLRHFVDGGAFNDAGLLTLGWFDDFPPMVQPYSGPASPYWASKGFLGLLLPADSPVWAQTEAASPVETSDAVRTLRAPGFVLSSTSMDGVVRLLNHGSDHQPSLEPGDDPAYSRFAYSSHTTPLYGTGTVDSHVAVRDEVGRLSRRTRIHRVLPQPDGVVASMHHPVWDDDEAAADWTITSASAVRGPYELRLHLVESAVAATRSVYESGYAAPADGSMVSRIVPLLDDAEVDETSVHGASPLGETLVPWIERAYDGTRAVYATLAVLSGDPEVLSCVDAITATASSDGSAVQVNLPDGQLSAALPG